MEHIRERGLLHQVYESLARSGEVPEEELAYFDAEGGEDLLYSLRFLAIDKRPPIARFIVERQMDAAARPSAVPTASGTVCCLQEFYGSCSIPLLVVKTIISMS